MRNNNIIAIWFLWNFTLVLSQEKNIPFYIGDIKIDGKLNEKIWHQAEVFSNFNNYFPDDNGKAQNKTEIKVFHDAVNIYIAAIYYDSSQKNKISSLKRDNHGGLVVGSDALGIVIDPFNKENNGYYFAVNIGNAQMDALIEFNGTDYNFSESWNTVWQSQTSTKGNKKIYEVAIPFKSLNFDLSNNTWGFQFFYRDFKTNTWMTYTDISRNFFQFDLRFTEDVIVQNLPQKSISKYTVTPSIVYNYQNNLTDKTNESSFKPSIDAQYSITSSLKLDLTINPDFSQVDVDQQVLNLTRFAINIPERRSFFLENSDLFNNLGTFGVNPFYSRAIGRSTDIQFGAKLSGNISSSSKIGILNAQTRKKGKHNAQNYTVIVGQKKISEVFTGTTYLVNRQETDDFDLTKDYNRVFGINLNYKSQNNLWSALANYGSSYSDGLSSNNNFFNIEGQYNNRETFIKAAFKTVERNFITDLGFTPRLYNYDAINNQTFRDSYLDSYLVFQKTYYPQKSKIIDRYRYLSLKNDAFWSSNGTLTEMVTVIGNSIWFKGNLSSLYINLKHSYYDLKYGFDILKNKNPIQPGRYRTVDINLGYNNQSTNQNFYYGLEAFHGGYFNGTQNGFEALAGYKLLPFAQVNVNYSLNNIDLKKLGKESFHLARFTGEVFFTNRLNWTSYVQYNTQFNNFNVNSRLQWEYHPLSYVYLVVTDNFDKQIMRTNWGIAAKINYRLDF